MDIMDKMFTDIILSDMNNNLSKEKLINYACANRQLYKFTGNIEEEKEIAEFVHKNLIYKNDKWYYKE